MIISSFNSSSFFPASLLLPLLPLMLLLLLLLLLFCFIFLILFSISSIKVMLHTDCCIWSPKNWKKLYKNSLWFDKLYIKNTFFSISFILSFISFSFSFISSFSIFILLLYVCITFSLYELYVVCKKDKTSLLFLINSSWYSLNIFWFLFISLFPFNIISIFFSIVVSFSNSFKCFFISFSISKISIVFFTLCNIVSFSLTGHIIDLPIFIEVSIIEAKDSNCWSISDNSSFNNFLRFDSLSTSNLPSEEGRFINFNFWVFKLRKSFLEFWSSINLCFKLS